MRTLTCLALCALEVRALIRTLRRHSTHGEVDEFLTNAPLDEIIRARLHTFSAMLLLQLATMMRLT